MDNFYWILLIHLSGVTYAIGGDGNSDTDLQAHPSAILPLTLLRVSATYLYPKHIELITTDNDGVIYYGLTKFSSWYDEEKTQQFFFCPPETRTSGGDCLYPKIFKQEEILQCATEPNPFVEMMTYKDDSGQIKGSPCRLVDKRGVWYKTGYKICIPETSKISKHEKILSRFTGREIKPTNDCSEFRVFEFCYSDQYKEVLYTDHLIRSPAFLVDNRFKYELNKTFDTSTEGYGSTFETVYELDKAIYEKLKNSESEYTSQWLVPPEDLVFAFWKKTAYHYLNKKPMREDQLGLWNYINDCIRKESAKRKAEFTIYTAAVVVHRKYRPSYVAEPIEKPDVWIKIIYHFYQGGTMCSGLAIVMNSSLDEDSWKKFHNKYCDKNLCEDVFNDQFPNVANTVQCCHPYLDLQKLFHVDFWINDTLQIEFSPGSSPDVSNKDVVIHQPHLEES